MSICGSFSSPKEGEQLHKGDTVTIKWSDWAVDVNETAKIGLFLSEIQSGKGHTIVDELQVALDTPSWLPYRITCFERNGVWRQSYPGYEMSYNWTVPESLAESPNYTISYYNQTANPFPSAADAVSNVFAIIASREPTSSPASPTSFPTSFPTFNPSPGGSSLSTGAKVGIGIGVALAVAFCILGAWTLLRRRRQSLRTFESCVEETRGFEKPEPDSKGTQQSMELDAESSKAELDSSNTQRRAELEVESSGTQGTGGIGTIISRKEPAELP